MFIELIDKYNKLSKMYKSNMPPFIKSNYYNERVKSICRQLKSKLDKTKINHEIIKEFYNFYSIAMKSSNIVFNNIIFINALDYKNYDTVSLKLKVSEILSYKIIFLVNTYNHSICIDEYSTTHNRRGSSYVHVQKITNIEYISNKAIDFQLKKAMVDFCNCYFASCIESD